MKNILEKFVNKLNSFLLLARFKLARRILPRLNVNTSAYLSLVHPFLYNTKEISNKNEVLIDIALKSIEIARRIKIDEISGLIKSGPKWPDIWPGEHYKLLAALVAHIRPKQVVEVGTFLGLSALTMKRFLPEGSTLLTYDLIPWRNFQETCFHANDFSDGILQQRLGDLAKDNYFDSQKKDIEKSDIIFLDGPKNVYFERKFIRLISQMKFTSKLPILVIDDIRLWNMIQIWHDIELPKLDLTSFGHFSGTGLVKLNGSDD